jgi:phosphoribosylamine-glycine ligase
MKILLMDENNIADSLSQVLLGEGHDVYATNDAYACSRHGVKTLGWRDTCSHVIDEPWDLVVACGTNVNRDGYVEMFRDRRIPTFGSGRLGFTMEEKHISRKIFNEMGMTSPKWFYFDSPTVARQRLYQLGIEHVVIKFTQTNRPFRTVVCNDLRDAYYILSKETNGGLVLEEKIEGVEVAMSWYFDGRYFVQSVTTFEHKYLWPGNMGVLTPEMGTALFYGPTRRWQHIGDSFLKSSEARFRFKDYRGFIDLNCIMDKRGNLYPLEFTCRFGVPQTDIMTALIKGDNTRYGEFLLSVANGRIEQDLAYRSEYAVGINLVVVGFPFHERFPDIIHKGSPIHGLDGLKSHHTLGSVKLDQGVPVTDGAWIMNITGTGVSMNDARTMAVQQAKTISFQNMIWRQDIGAGYDDVKESLYKFGVIPEEFAR